MGRAKDGPLTADERLGRITGAEQKLRKAEEAHELAKKAAKLAATDVELAQDALRHTIRDDPEGELGYRDGGRGAEA